MKVITILRLKKLPLFQVLSLKWKRIILFKLNDQVKVQNIKINCQTSIFAMNQFSPHTSRLDYVLNSNRNSPEILPLRKPYVREATKSDYKNQPLSFGNHFPTSLQSHHKQQKISHPTSPNKQNFSNNPIFSTTRITKLNQKSTEFNAQPAQSPKKNENSQLICELSNQSKNFIQQSIKKTLQGSLSVSDNKTEKIQNSSHKKPQIPQNSHILIGLSREHSSVSQPESKQRSPRLYNNRNGVDYDNISCSGQSLSNIESLSSNQQILDYFLTEEDEKNENSEEGIQLLSQLKTELNSLINGSPDMTSQRVFHEVRAFRADLSRSSVLGKTQLNAGDKLALKIQQLKSNIFGLFSLICPQKNSLFNCQTTHPNFIEVINSQQPQLFFQLAQKDPTKLIYPDSKIILQTNENSHMYYNDPQFSKVITASQNEIVQSTSVVLENQNTSKIFIDLSSGNHQLQAEPHKVIQSNSKLWSNHNQKDDILFSEAKDSQKQLYSDFKTELQKQAFQLLSPKFSQFEPENGDRSFKDQVSKPSQLEESSVSSVSNQSFKLEQINRKFNSKFNEWLQSK